ncbi:MULTISPECIES: hypothetical protein [unclassified Devosia]|jgi:hypothetical protein|uniref:hypothetical protein n=1 Tax=unclassified Devosia TaxID=196773 RepID=UPI0015FE0635|nr:MULTISPECIES: hypothetical protein [unclassified Devosia]MBJ6986420.1 hypothetical protein [Devosia sp. MC521]MBJ7576533.1 hypothetical protein [Devosia sp. MC532]QMW64110.1 hypothetical protein H4N61_07335 [Devosia sp. MC521]
MSTLESALQRVGRLNYVWTNTESLFIYLIAHLLGASKDGAIIVFLTLNTTRARLDLLQRLAKLPAVDPDDRQAVLSITDRLGKESALRNKFNHCIYSFDRDGAITTQLMRISDLHDDIRYGKTEALDDAELKRIDAAITRIVAVNKAILAFIQAKGISY